MVKTTKTKFFFSFPAKIKSNDFHSDFDFGFDFDDNRNINHININNNINYNSRRSPFRITVHRDPISNDIFDPIFSSFGSSGRRLIALINIYSAWA